MAHNLRERAEDLGYQRGRCPHCGRTIWSDTSVFECSCGYSNIPMAECDDCGSSAPEADIVEYGGKRYCPECFRVEQEEALEVAAEAAEIVEELAERQQTAAPHA